MSEAIDAYARDRLAKQQLIIDDVMDRLETVGDETHALDHRIGSLGRRVEGIEMYVVGDGSDMGPGVGLAKRMDASEENARNFETFSFEIDSRLRALEAARPTPAEQQRQSFHGGQGAGGGPMMGGMEDPITGEPTLPPCENLSLAVKKMVGYEGTLTYDGCKRVEALARERLLPPDTLSVERSLLEDALTVAMVCFDDKAHDVRCALRTLLGEGSDE